MLNKEFKIIEREITVNEYNEVREAAGLSRKPEIGIEKALKNTLFSVCAESQNKTVGIGRVIGDGGCFFEIVDIAVIKSCHGKGIGHSIMKAVMKYLDVNAPDGSFISLIAGEGVSGFYEKYGFEVRPLSRPGMAMIKS